MRLEQKKVAVSVPKIFLEDRWDHVNGASHNSQLFRVTLDTFEPIGRKQASLQNHNGIHNRMTFVVGDRVEQEALASVLADEFQPVSTRTVRLSINSRRGRATHQERRRG